MKKLLLVVLFTLVASTVFATNCEDMRKVCYQITKLKNMGVSEVTVLGATDNPEMKSLISTIYEAGLDISPETMGLVCYEKCVGSK